MGILKVRLPPTTPSLSRKVTQTNDPMGILKVQQFNNLLGLGGVTQTNDPMGILKEFIPLRYSQELLVTQTNDPMGILKVWPVCAGSGAASGLHRPTIRWGY